MQSERNIRYLFNCQFVSKHRSSRKEQNEVHFNLIDLVVNWRLSKEEEEENALVQNAIRSI